MELLYISSFMFKKVGDRTYGLPSCADSFFHKYLDVFESVRVLGENVKNYLNESSLIELLDKRISVRVIPGNTQPKDFRNDSIIRNILKEEIEKSEAVLIKPSSRKGMMAIELAKKMNKPYMIEITGDIHNALRQNPSFLKRCYAPFLYKSIKRHIIDCKFGLYVSEHYLQRQFPINGEMCGCSDVILNSSSVEVLKSRINKIDATDFTRDKINLALIGFYQGKMKGVDCAIRALSHLPENFHLHILGNGTIENRNKWIEYGKEFGVVGRIHFPDPLPNSNEVCRWLNSMDIFAFPTHSEGFSRALVEAMSQGLPCFATNICTMPELLEEKCLFELNDDNKLADLILCNTGNKEELCKISKRNFNKAKEYDFEILRERRNRFLLKFREYCEKVK